MADPFQFADPFRGFAFKVEFGGFITAGFAEAGGFSEECSVLEYAECTNPFWTTKVPDRFSFSNVTFKKGKTGNRDLVNWWLEVKGKRVVSAFKRDGLVHVIEPLSPETILATLKIRQAWPVKLSWTDLVAKDTHLVIESLEIAHEGIDDLNLSRSFGGGTPSATGGSGGTF